MLAVAIFEEVVQAGLPAIADRLLIPTLGPLAVGLEPGAVFGLFHQALQHLALWQMLPPMEEFCCKIGLGALTASLQRQRHTSWLCGVGWVVEGPMSRSGAVHDNAQAAKVRVA